MYLPLLRNVGNFTLLWATLYPGVDLIALLQSLFIVDTWVGLKTPTTYKIHEQP